MIDDMTVLGDGGITLVAFGIAGWIGATLVTLFGPLPPGRLQRTAVRVVLLLSAVSVLALVGGLTYFAIDTAI